jgi:hypothetical protein
MFQSQLPEVLRQRDVGILTATHIRAVDGRMQPGTCRSGFFLPSIDFSGQIMLVL